MIQKLIVTETWVPAKPGQRVAIQFVGVVESSRTPVWLGGRPRFCIVKYRKTPVVDRIARSYDELSPRGSAASKR